MENHFWDLLMLANGLQVVRKVDTREEIHEIDSVTEKPSVPLQKKSETIREELKQSLVEESQKLKQWEKLFEKRSSSKAN